MMTVKVFCACAFMDKVFIIGGYYFVRDDNELYEPEFDATNSCLQYDTKDNTWKEVVGMNEARRNTACAVFEGNIVVSGGIDNNYIDLKTVESYNVVADEWSSLPNMNDSVYCHSLVVVRNKLFSIRSSSDSFEVFESVSKKFVSLKSTNDFKLNEAISIGNKIVIFQNDSISIFCYDVDTNEWLEKSCEFTKRLDNFSCVKISKY